MGKKILISSICVFVVAVVYAQISQNTGEGRSILSVVAIGFSIITPFLNLTYLIQRNSSSTIKLNIGRHVVPSFVLLLLIFIFSTGNYAVDTLIQLMLATNIIAGIWVTFNNMKSNEEK